MAMLRTYILNANIFQMDKLYTDTLRTGVLHTNISFTDTLKMAILRMDMLHNYLRSILAK